MDIELTQSSEPEIVVPPAVPTGLPWQTNLTGSLRFKFFLTGFVFPLVCLVILVCWRGGYTPHSPWQTGQLMDYVIVLTRPPAILWFYPIIAYSLISLALWCWQPEKFSQFMPIRLGLQTGIILALIFLVLLCITTSFMGPVMGIAVMVILAFLTWFIKRFAKRYARFSILNLMILTTIVAILLALLFGSANQERASLTSSFAGYLFLALLFVCGGSPTTGLVTFVRTTIAATHLHNALPKSRFRLAAGLGWVSWMATLGASWKIAIETMMVEYAKLPTTDPNCYVSSAAASGHCWLVRTQQSGLGVVSLQMKRCKFLEFVLVASVPATAAKLRKIYNRFGPALARICRSNCWFADATYLALKPLEVIAVFCQRILKIEDCQILKIYDDSAIHDPKC